VAVTVGVGVAVLVTVGVGVRVAVSVGTTVWVAVAVGVGVRVAVTVGVGVAVTVAVGVGVGVRVAVTVAVAVGVGVRVAVTVAVAVGVGVRVAVTVGVGVGGTTTHSFGYSGSKPGTASRTSQSTLNSVTQSTHATSCVRLLTGPPHAEPPGTVTLGQLDGKPIDAGLKSPTPLQSLSSPPHALQMLAIFLSSAFWIAATALPSPGFGQSKECLPLWRASQHFPSALVFDEKNADVALPIAV
jgi:hypothetical protein